MNTDARVRAWYTKLPREREYQTRYPVKTVTCEDVIGLVREVLAAEREKVLAEVYRECGFESDMRKYVVVQMDPVLWDEARAAYEKLKEKP